MPAKVWKLKAAGMSTAGMTVSKIANELRMDRSEVLAYLISRQAEGIASWTSAKTRITNRVKSLTDEERPREKGGAGDRGIKVRELPLQKSENLEQRESP